MVLSTFVTAWRLATSPTSTSPFLAKATTDGVVLAPGDVFSVSRTAAAYLRFNVAQSRDPRVVAARAAAPDPRAVVPLDGLDPRADHDCVAACTGDDPSGLSQAHTYDEFPRFLEIVNQLSEEGWRDIPEEQIDVTLETERQVWRNLSGDDRRFPR